MCAGRFVSSDAASYTKLNEVFLRIKNAMEWEFNTIFDLNVFVTFCSKI